ncbi:hypothetical protein NKG94_33930 [Micromonospora sp. M12]
MIGASLLGGGAVSLVTVAAVFLSNVPEGLSSAAGMRQAGRSRRYVFLLWTGIALISGWRRCSATRCWAAPRRRCWPASRHWPPVRSSR